MKFNKLELSNSRELRPFFKDNECRICDFTFGGTFIWRDYHKTEYAIDEGTLFFRTQYPGLCFAPPIGAETGIKAYEKIIRYCENANIAPRMCCVTEGVLSSIMEMFPKSVATTDRAMSDYLYKSEDLKELSGRKYSGQRNQISKFIRDNYSWEFEAVSNENLSQVKAYFEKHYKENIKDSSTYKEGNLKSLEVLEHLKVYKALGGALFAGGKVIGVSLGEILGDTLYVHIEKADTSYRGAYQMLTNQFAKMYAGEGVEFINREEDDGDEGLRTSKLSYHPHMLLHKYIVQIVV